MRLRTIRPAALRGKHVVLRADFNVPMRNGRVATDAKLRAALPTLRSYTAVAKTLTVLSHFGRPTRAHDPAASLAPIARRLAKLLKHPVTFLPDGATQESAEIVRRLPRGSVALLENTRFERGEHQNSRALAKRFAAFGEVFILDAFPSLHHDPDASTVGIGAFLPSYAGPLLTREVTTIDRLLSHPLRPYVAVVGGAKVDTKIGLLHRLLEQADHVCVGGAIANTMLRARGIAVGASRVETSLLPLVRKLPMASCKLKIPVDLIVSTPRLQARRSWIRAVGDVRPGEVILDIGPDTRELFVRVISSAKLVVWNGPLGLFEQRRYARGTEAIARAIARAKAETIVGGGDTVEAIERLKLQHRFTLVSTAGGAMLEFIEGKSLPGLTLVSR